MERAYYLNLAASGHRLPIGTHLVLHRHADPGAIVLDGERLGAVIAETAEAYRTPLAVPLMDLTLEKAALLEALGVPADQVDSHHFDEPPGDVPAFRPTARMEAACGAIRHVAQRPGLVPIGMAIGPFSLMTKLVADPISPVFMAGAGMTAEEEPEVALVERAIAVGTEIVLAYVAAQIDAGAKAIVICEPAANLVYFSPKQLAEDFGVFDRFVMQGMRRVRALLAERGVDLIFHDCGELTGEMVRRFGELDAAVMSLGSSRVLWEDAALVPKTTVLYGNLPTKRFYSAELTVGEVERIARELVERMRAAEHPFILGSECDVLSVPGSERAILDKVDAFLRA